MSWGDGKYMDYCLKVKVCIAEKIKDIINKKYKYVSKNANVDKEDFIRDIVDLINDKDFIEEIMSSVKDEDNEEE